MKKPEPKTKVAYDYDDVIDWIETKYGINTRDFAGKFGRPPADPYNGIWDEPNKNNQPPYLDFWHWLIKQYDPRRESYMTIQLRAEEGFEHLWDAQPRWVNAILAMIDDEFPDEDGEIEVWVDW